MKNLFDLGLGFSLPLTLLSVGFIGGVTSAAAQPAPAVSTPSEGRAEVLEVADKPLGAAVTSAAGVATSVDLGGIVTPDEVTAPVAGAKDWVQLVSGEWLRGALKGMRQGSVEFVSDEVGLVKLDWAKVRGLVAGGEYSYVDEDYGSSVGPALLKDGKLYVLDGGRVVTLGVDALLSIVSVGRSEISKWSWSAYAGLDVSIGNSEQSSLSFSTTLKRMDAVTRTKLVYDGRFGRAAGVDTVNNHSGVFTFDIFVSNIFFISAFNGQAYYDEFKNIALRLTPGSGIGFHVISAGGVTLDLGAGVNYQYLKNISVPAGGDRVNHSAMASLKATFEWDITADVDLDIEHTSYLGITAFDDSYFNTTASLDVELTSMLTLTAKMIHSRVRAPVPDDTGSVPKKDDLSVTAGLTVTL